MSDDQIPTRTIKQQLPQRPNWLDVSKYISEAEAYMTYTESQIAALWRTVHFVEAERDQLREALKQISESVCYQEMPDIARAALAPTQKSADAQVVPE